MYDLGMAERTGSSGKKAQIKVTFDPAGRPGPFTKTISVYSNGKTGSFIMNIRGEVE